MSVLWSGVNAPYPSAFSARWAVRKMREELVQEQAVALHRGRMLVHTSRFAQVGAPTARAGAG